MLGSSENSLILSQRNSREHRVTLYLLVILHDLTSNEGVVLFHYVNCQGFLPVKFLSTELTNVESVLWDL